jgi:hypothetical protein
MLRFAVRRSNGGARVARFGVCVRDDNRGRTPPLVRLKGVCGPGDDGAPVVTVTLTDEDQRTGERVARERQPPPITACAKEMKPVTSRASALPASRRPRPM